MRILICEDEVRFGRILLRVLAENGHPGAILAGDAEEALDVLAEQAIDLLVTDLRLPGMDGLALMAEARRRRPDLPVVLMTAFAEVATARSALQRGALDYLVKPFDNQELLDLVERAAALRTPDSDRGAADTFFGMIGDSPAMRTLRDRIRKVAASDATVLVLGASGTGKELVARALHGLSPRHAGPLVMLNCAAIPEHLLESELFGHERGAFTGAVAARPGCLAQASGGTLVLDEIGELPLGLQPKLLRAIETRSFHRVGSDQPVRVDLRLVASTNRDLEAEVAAGRFRGDLFYRLDVARILLPPLRERGEDAVLILESLLTRRGLPPEHLGAEARRQARTCPWPGNVRQLVNAFERALIDAGGGPVQTLALEGVAPPSGTAPSPEGDTGSLDLADREIAAIRRALVEAGGNKAQAARLLGITRRRLYSRLERLGLADGPTG